ncbi:MAG: BatD family protein [Bacteroidota bacterium]
MKKILLLMASTILFSVVASSQEDAKLTVEVSNDSILLGNYIEVRFIVSNAAVQNFEAPNFNGFNIISGPSQSTSMMISNGAMSQTVTYSYYVEPMAVGAYFIQPAYVDTDKGPLESMPIEVWVVENPDGIKQHPQQQRLNDFFSQDDFFGGDSFFGNDDFFKDFFNRNKNPFFNDDLLGIPKEDLAPIKKKKKRKTYKL